MAVVRKRVKINIPQNNDGVVIHWRLGVSQMILETLAGLDADARRGVLDRIIPDGIAQEIEDVLVDYIDAREMARDER